MPPTASRAKSAWRKRKAFKLKNKVLFFFSIVLIVLMLDLWSKDAMWAYFDRNGASTIEVTSWFNWHRAYNRGMAFSFFDNHPEWLLVFASTISIVLIPVALKSSPNTKVLFMWALIVGGAMGNVVDRIRSRLVEPGEHLYYAVRDFIQVHWKGDAFPTFNLADSCICIGVTYIFLYSFIEETSGKR